MGDHVVHFAGDAPSLVGRGVFGQRLLRLNLFGQQYPLGVHEIADQPGARDEQQIQGHHIDAMQRGRGEQQRG